MSISLVICTYTIVYIHIMSIHTNCLSVHINCSSVHINGSSVNINRLLNSMARQTKSDVTRCEQIYESFIIIV